MTDERDFDRRTVLKAMGSAAAAGPVGSVLASQPATAYTPSYTPDWYATHENVLPIRTNRRVFEETAGYNRPDSFPDRGGCDSYDREYVSPGRFSHTCVQYLDKAGFADVDTDIGGFGEYGVTRGSGTDKPDNRAAWNDDDSGPSAGDTAVVWAHGWQSGGLYGSGADDAVRDGMHQADLAWDAMDNVAEDGPLEYADHTIGWAWNSASATANFESAVGQAHRIGPDYYSTFIQDLARRVQPSGNIHLAAHSLGCWMTLEALAEVYQREGDDGPVGDVLDTIRFISGAVPSSAVGGQGGGNSGWTNLEGHWSGGVGPGSSTPCARYEWDTSLSPPRKRCVKWDDPSRTYDHNALLLPNRVVNGYYDCDEVLSTTCCWSVNPKCGPFRLYVKNFDEGSSSEAIGTRPLTDTMESPAKENWENVDMTEHCPTVADHSGAYKHPDHSGSAGGGQFSVWHPDRVDNCIGN